MTAEVAIANASAIALAADSAVSIGDQKIYNSALKLFSLSKVAPVGVMIYGNADLLDIPWETLIKAHRKILGGQTFEKLEQYANSFLTYLQTSPGLFSEETQQRWLSSNVGGYYTLIRDEFFSTVENIIKERGEIKPGEAPKILANIVKTHYDDLKSREFAQDFGETHNKEIRSKYSDVFAEIRKEIFENLPLSTTIASRLTDIACLIHTKQIFSTGMSGLVIAGYGESELYPAISTFDVEGVILGKLKYRVNIDKSHTITANNQCRIIAFAQEDMVATFMNGINPQVLSFLQSYLTHVFSRLPELLGDKDAVDDDVFKGQVKQLLEGFWSMLRRHLAEEQASPVLRMVTVLPKDELAAMAEALVNLTAFKRRITESRETVGGPIDVAVISKGDGFIWVKRKHYFPPELNQHFFANYFRGIPNGQHKE
jgi:hypothetical protein